MGATEALIAAINQTVDYFNRRTLDLPDGLFARKTQFVINGTPFEALLSATPNDPLVLMLSRGPAGYRFAIKALQHAVPDARIDVSAAASPPGSLRLLLSGALRGSGEMVQAPIAVTLRLDDAGLVEVAEATVDENTLQKIRDARLRP